MRTENWMFLALGETKFKGKGKEWFGNVLRVKSGVGEKIRAKEGVELLLKQELRECESVL